MSPAGRELPLGGLMGIGFVIGHIDPNGLIHYGPFAEHTGIVHIDETDLDPRWWMGGYGLVLHADVELLAEPLPCTGAQGLWTAPSLDGVAMGARTRRHVRLSRAPVSDRKAAPRG